MKALDSDLDALHSENKGATSSSLINHGSSDDRCEIPSRNVEAVPIFEAANVSKGRECEVLMKIYSERNGSTNKNDDRHNGDRRREMRSISPFSRDSALAIKYKEKEEQNDTTSDHSLGRYRNSEDTMHSPSLRRRLREGHYKDRSRSRDRSSKGDGLDQHKVRSGQSVADMDVDHNEREMSISHSKHDGREERYGDYNREKDVGGVSRKERERSSSYSRHSRYSDHERERIVYREHRREKDRSSSASIRYDRDRGTRESDRDSVRDRDMEKRRDASRERYREREGSRDVYRERERKGYGYDRDRGSNRDRGVDLDTDREHGRHNMMDRTNVRGNQRDSRHSKFDERDQHGDKTRSKELVKEPASARHDNLGGKRESLR